MNFDREKVMAKLKEINERVMAKLGSPTKDELAYPTVKRVMEMAADEGVEGSRALLDSGMLDKVSAVTDESKAKAFEEEITLEIKRAIRSGELPPPSKDPLYRKWKPRKRKKK